MSLRERERQTDLVSTESEREREKQIDHVSTNRVIDRQTDRQIEIRGQKRQKKQNLSQQRETERQI